MNIFYEFAIRKNFSKVLLLGGIAFLVFFMMFFGLAFADESSGAVGSASAAATEVIVYKPRLPVAQKKPEIGSCFATSIAMPRQDAWRCFVGNEIHDPCFSVVIGEKERLICDANPITKAQGFELQLTQPLPQPDKIFDNTPKVWILVLDDGSICEPYTGTLPLLSSEKSKLGMQYWCLDGEGKKSGIIYNSIQIGALWKAQQVFYSKDKKGNFKIDSTKEVNIKAVWK